MLVLSRHKNEAIVIDPRNCPRGEDGLIRIVVVDIRGDKVRLGCEASKDTAVHRQEVWDAIQREQLKAADAVQAPPAPLSDFGSPVPVG